MFKPAAPAADKEPIMRKLHQKELADLVAVQAIQAIRNSQKSDGQVGPVMMSDGLMSSILDIEGFREDLKNKLTVLMPDFYISRNADIENQHDQTDRNVWFILFSKK